MKCKDVGRESEDVNVDKCFLGKMLCTELQLLLDRIVVNQLFSCISTKTYSKEE